MTDLVELPSGFLLYESYHLVELLPYVIIYSSTILLMHGKSYDVQVLKSVHLCLRLMPSNLAQHTIRQGVITSLRF